MKHQDSIQNTVIQNQQAHKLVNLFNKTTTTYSQFSSLFHFNPSLRIPYVTFKIQCASNLISHSYI